MGAIANFAAGAAQAGAGLYGQQALEEQKAQVDVMKAQRIAEINDQMAQATEARHMTQNVAIRQQTAQRFGTAIDSANNAALLDNYNKDNPNTPQTSVDSLAEEEKAAYQPNDVQLGRHLVRQLGMQGELSGKEIVAENRSESQNAASMAKSEAYDTRTDALAKHWAEADGGKAQFKDQLVDIKQQILDQKLAQHDLPDSDRAKLNLINSQINKVQSRITSWDPGYIKKNPDVLAKADAEIDGYMSALTDILGVKITNKPSGAIGAANKPAFDPSKFMGK